MDPTVPCYDASIKSMYYDNLTYDACSNARAWSFLIYDASFQWTDRCHYFVTIDPVIPEAYIQSANAKKHLYLNQPVAGITEHGAMHLQENMCSIASCNTTMASPASFPLTWSSDCLLMDLNVNNRMIRSTQFFSKKVHNVFIFCCTFICIFSCPWTLICYYFPFMSPNLTNIRDMYFDDSPGNMFEHYYLSLVNDLFIVWKLCLMTSIYLGYSRGFFMNFFSVTRGNTRAFT